MADRTFSRDEIGQAFGVDFSLGNDLMLTAAMNCLASDLDDVAEKMKARGLLSADAEVALSDAKAVLFEAWQELGKDLTDD